MSMFVKVVRMPGAVKEVAVENGSNVAAALTAAEITVGETETLTLNGVSADTTHLVYDGDRIVLAKEAKSA